MIGEFPSLNEPNAKIHITDALKHVLRCGSHKNGSRNLGENGPKFPHLRLVSFGRIEIMQLRLLLLLLLLLRAKKRVGWMLSCLANSRH